MKTLGVLSLLVAVLSHVVFSPLPTVAADPLKHVVLQLRWDNQFQFAGYYAADWQGYYREEGLEVEIRPALLPDGRILSATEEVVADRADFGVGGADILLAVDKGADIRVISTIFQKSAARLYLKEVTPFSALVDMRDLRVARHVNDLIDVEFQAMLLSQGIDPQTITPYPLRAGIEPLLSDQIQVMPGYVTSLPFYAAETGVALREIAPASYGINFYGDSLFASGALISQDPETAERFVRASLRGWEYALEHPDEIADGISSRFDRSDKIADVVAFNRFQADVVRELTLYTIVDLGHTNPFLWDQMNQHLRGIGLVQHELDLNTFIFDPQKIREEQAQLIDQYVTWGLIGATIALLLIFSWVFLLRRIVRQKTLELQGQLILQQRAEHAARTSEAQLRTLIEQASDGIFIASPEGRYIDVNSAGCRLLGYTRDEILQKTMRNVTIVPTQAPLRINELHEGKVFLSEREMIHKDGSRIPVEISAKQLSDGRFQGIVRDVTERRRAEAEREHLHAQLLQAQKMETVGRLAGGIAHDFNNMLAVILMRTEMALYMVDPASPVHRNLTAIHTTSLRSAELVRQLLGFARKQTIAPKVLDLNAAVEGILPMLRKLIDEGINLIWRPGNHLWPVKIDPLQLEQVLTNLCVNARDAIHGVGAITLETRSVAAEQVACSPAEDVAPGDYVMLAVTDTGNGIDGETLKHIFEPFFTTKEVGKGTGLGLATVDGIVQQNGGYIQVRSEIGAGSSFRIYLPRVGSSVTEPAPSQPSAHPQGRGETVLLVEDEAAVLGMGKEALHALGYQVMTANSPAEALRLATNRPGRIDLLITDIVMPEMNGRDLAEEIMAFRPDIRVIFMSGYPADIVAQRGVLVQGMHFLQKPFSLHALAAKLKEALADLQADTTAGTSNQP